MRQSSRLCPTCGKNTLHANPTTLNPVLGIVISLFTCGLMLPLWIWCMAIDQHKWTCQLCGKDNSNKMLRPIWDQKDEPIQAQAIEVEPPPITNTGRLG